MSATMIVGKYYRVPVVEASIDMRVGFYVVLGAWHEDKQWINFEKHHYHLDLRFAPQWIIDSRRWPHSIAVHDPLILSGPFMRRRKMRREMPLFPIARGYIDGHPFPALCSAFADSQLGPHQQCPHKGLSLASLQPVNGVLVCPLHGLCFDAASGRNIAPTVAAERISPAVAVTA